ncbi:hypothetical protein Pla175_31570 [Pirellulimonas nuda]|uniref:Uncharacterized protein n=1 Tax=Pirellulimonas nuda TaxID=2528009 RepID=A0A518DEA8_9BACT|nr:hypothetical protein Pla175_31570 [Pirellulimonas nuda]
MGVFVRAARLARRAGAVLTNDLALEAGKTSGLLGRRGGFVRFSSAPDTGQKDKNTSQQRLC